MVFKVFFGLVIMATLLVFNRRIGSGLVMLALWLSLILLALIINGIIPVSFSGLVYIETCCILFFCFELIGYKSKVCFATSIKKVRHHIIDIRRVERYIVLGILIGLFLCVFVFKSYHYSFSSFGSFTSTMIEAYRTEGSGGMIISLLLSVFNCMFAIDGYIYVYSKVKKEKYNSKFLVLLGIIFIYSLLVAQKTPLIWCILLWFAGFLTSISKFFLSSKDSILFVKRNVIKIAKVAIIILVLLVMMMAIRSSWTIKEAIRVFSVYLIDEVDVFSIWFSRATKSELQFSHGRQLFFGFFDQIGLNSNIVWNWNIDSLASQYGFYSNIYSVFWTVIQDFGFLGSYVFWIIFGYIAGKIRRNIVKNDSYYFYSFLLLFVYFFVLISFITSSGHSLVNLVAQFWFFIFLNNCTKPSTSSFTDITKNEFLLTGMNISSSE